MNHTLLSGNVPRCLLRFAAPLLFANFLQSFYSIADMAIVGQLVGSTGLAAVSSASMLVFIINSVCTGVTMGGAALVAQYKGADDAVSQAEVTHTLFVLSALSAVLVTIAGLLAYRPILTLMDVPRAAMLHALAYMQVICLETIFVFGYNAACSILRGLGDSIGPLLFVAIAAAVNIALDFLFVGGFQMGTRGAAAATVLSQGVSFSIALVFLRQRYAVFHFINNPFLIKYRHIKSILKIGIPSAIQMTVLNLSYLIVTGMLNGYGVAISAAAGIGLKINTFAAMPCWAIGQAVTTMAGQCIGAQMPQRAEQTAKTGLFCAVASGIIMTLAIQLFAGPAISLFIPIHADPAVLQAGILYLRICCSINFLAYAVMYIFDSFATGVGDAFFAMFNALLHSITMRLLLSWLLAVKCGLGYIGICLGEAIAPIIPAIVGVCYFLRGAWRSNDNAARNYKKDSD